MNPFDYVNSINHKKNNLMNGSDNDELSEKLYNPYVVNKALSYFADTIMFANQINQLHGVDSKLQYEYLLNSIKPKKRFSKWVKREDNDEIEMIKLYFNYSDKKARQVYNLLSSDQINNIRNELVRGKENESSFN
jgi:hypothetical protein